MLRLLLILALLASLLLAAPPASAQMVTPTLTPVPSQNCYTLASTLLYGAQRVEWPSPPFSISSAGLDTIYQSGYNDWYVTALSGSFVVVYGHTSVGGNPSISFDAVGGDLGLVSAYLPSAYEVWTASDLPFSLRICSSALPTPTLTPIYLSDFSYCDSYSAISIAATQSAHIFLINTFHYRVYSQSGSIAIADYVIPAVPNVPGLLIGASQSAVFYASAPDILYICQVPIPTVTATAMATDTATATATATDTATATATATDTAIVSPSVTPTLTVTPPALPCVFANSYRVPLAPNLVELPLIAGQTLMLLDAPIFLNVGAVAREIRPGTYSWADLSGSYQAYSVTVPAVIWLCVAAFSTPTATVTTIIFPATVTPYISGGDILNPTSGILDSFANKEPFHGIGAGTIMFKTVTADWSAQSPVVMPETCSEVVAIPDEPSGSPGQPGTDILNLDLGAKTATGICNVINITTKYRYFMWYASTLMFAIIFGRYLFTLPRRLSGTSRR